MSRPAPSASRRRYFRPWGTDSRGVIVKETDAGLIVRYDHAPGREHFIPTKELARVGRIVTDPLRQ